MLGGPRLEVDAAAPGLAQGAGGGGHQAGQLLDAVQLAQRRLRDGRPQRLQQRVFLHRLRQSAGQPHRELLDAHDLPAVAVRARRAQALLSRGHATVGDYRMAIQSHASLIRRRVEFV